MPNQAYGWKAVPAIPGNEAGGRPGVWKELLEDFIASGKPYALLDGLNGRKVESVVPQLVRQAKMHRLPVKIHRRGPSIYLSRDKSS